ncbi:MAG: rhodanese-like domain-containing protein [Candidatus Aminicenantes bacterium]|nr:rhodanese-like domain-containing protein [Candidatus Aminicenantes bacterium]
MKIKEIFGHRETWQGIAVILGLSIILACVTQFGLIKRFWQGEFKQGFVRGEEFPGLVFISLAEAESLWASGEALMVDSRSREEYAAGHVPGAFSLPLVEVKNGQDNLLQLLPEDKPLVVYCEGGSCQTSLALAKILSKKGYRNIKVFSGGWEEWLQAGLPVEN